MACERSLSDLYTLTGASALGLDWPDLLAQALADGRGEIVAPDEERAAAADELLTCSLGELIVLGELAAYVAFAPLAEECRRPLARTSAGLVRLLARRARSRPQLPGRRVARAHGHHRSGGRGLSGGRCVRDLAAAGHDPRRR